MARVTIEGVLGKGISRFEAAFLVSYRAHVISNTGFCAVDCTNKSVVKALREIESGRINLAELRNVVLKKCALDKQVKVASDSFIADDNSVVPDFQQASDSIGNNNTSVKHVSLDIDSNYFA